MKFKKMIGSLLLYMGTLSALAGLLATVVPLIQNDQVRLILSSISAPDTRPMVNATNQLLLFILQYHYQVLAVGAVAAVAGIVLHWNQEAPGKVPQRTVSMSSEGPYAIVADLPNQSPAKPSSDWRRPVSGVPFPSNEDFRGMEPPLQIETNPFSRPVQPAEEAPNPFRSYGQNAYAPPAKTASENTDTNLEADAYQRPTATSSSGVPRSDAADRQPDSHQPEDAPFTPEEAYLSAKTAFAAEPAEEPPITQAYAARRSFKMKEAPPSSHAFRKPRLSITREDTLSSPEDKPSSLLPPLAPTPPVDPPETPPEAHLVPIRSTIKALKGAQTAEPTSTDIIPPKGPDEDEPDAAREGKTAKVEYVSKRIRSTMGKK